MSETVDPMLTRAKALLVLLCVALAATLPARAQDYPARSITLVVPFPAGGGVDSMGRIVADQLTLAFGQQVVVENRGGAAGVIGTRAAAKAAPDGYTLVMSTSGTTTINPSLYANPGYDPLKDFAPIGLVAATPIVVMTHPSLPAGSLAELIALAKAQPGKLDIGTPPPGTENYLAAELFKAATAVEMTIVAYKGTGPLTNDLVGGHVRVGFNTIAPALGQIQSGNLRAIAVAGRARSRLLPDVPTFIESGLPGFEAVVRYGLLAPAGTPRPIIERINAELRAMVESDATAKRIAAAGGEPLATTPDEYAADIARDQARWGALISKLGLRVE
ncbi:MAG TPA: tripartite tricarboxylate transporter substrate binding protein [Xanthobacteraceae bacterium]|nr:tripartite tricarboxylate transporter substrate binding protein [Xanthobacteraceae bacterium]